MWSKVDSAQSQSNILIVHKLRIQFFKISGEESQIEITLTKASVACPPNDSPNEANLTKASMASFVCSADNCGKKDKNQANPK